MSNNVSINILVYGLCSIAQSIFESKMAVATEARLPFQFEQRITAALNEICNICFSFKLLVYMISILISIFTSCKNSYL